MTGFCNSLQLHLEARTNSDPAQTRMTTDIDYILSYTSSQQFLITVQVLFDLDLAVYLSLSKVLNPSDSSITPLPEFQQKRQILHDGADTGVAGAVK